ncbi:DEAD/DEAH box helicase [Bacillus coahuilensis]|uniref:DEAD/DEAH box helicase n=1 Tax=Bacillus coahuilensis TaxID=408580 RepID=UPI000AE8BB8A|nr:DEAD/DEAH box helicase [Bacillus coahuilensis]
MKEERLITNSSRGNLLKELTTSLQECQQFYFSVAFINFSGLQLLLDSFKDAELRGVKGKVLTSTYLNFTEVKALEKIKEFQNIQLKVFVTDREIGFHTKVYIFEYEDYYKVIVGSSNITQSALKSNIEWNVEIVTKREGTFIQDVLSEYQQLWDSSNHADDDLISRYEDLLLRIKQTPTFQSHVLEKGEYIVPNRMQRKAMDNLERLRYYGEKKALVISATGTGKTYMSAFDVKNYQPKRLLFIVHREEILKKARDTFKNLMTNRGISFGLFTGNHKEQHADYVFSTIQTLTQRLHEFEREAFDYIIVDEAHHATSPSYERVLNYFTPDFLLGMTATPERSDHQNVFELFDHNVAMEVRLHDALEDELIVPFHYFGITDIDGVDLRDVDVDDVAEVTKRLKVNERVDFIIEKMEFYSQEGEKRKCLGFCASIEHGEFMEREFNRRGYHTVLLHGGHSQSYREQVVNRLEDDQDELEIIFSVDIFNEGVDIPSVNSVLMLRPTNSPIVFIQQLGRGLRKHQDKTFLTVLDFIGNHSKVYLIALALNGSRYYDKESLKVAIATGFQNIPGATHIQMDEIAKDRILAQIDQENFNSLKYLKEEYFEFKKLNQGKVPLYLVDYLTFDGAPNPVKFIDRDKSYLQFVAKVEKDESLKKLLLDETFESVLKELSSKLPLKRIHEFVILKYLLTHDTIRLNQAATEILKHVNHVDQDTILHAFHYLNQDYYDSMQKKGKEQLVGWNGTVLAKTEAFQAVLNKPEFRPFIEDVLHYGIFRYEKEYGHHYYGVPHFKLYEQYQMIDAALLSNYQKTHTAFRGSGLLTNGNNYFLFIDLHKEADIKESINYQDEFLSEHYFQWQTPNATAPGSERGKNIIYNKDRGIHLHLFVRKYKQLDGKIEPYIYIGKGNTVEFEGEKPITVKLKLEHKIPANLYREFTERV